MPYRGKPSSGCGECRKRRSRCDRAVPSCGQCIKTGRTCPGYRNSTDLMFHDQSTHVVKKITGHTSFIVEQPIAKRRAPKTPKNNVAPFGRPHFVMFESLEDLGLNFFMSKVAVSDPNVCQLYYIPSFYAKTGYAHAGLHNSIVAIGLTTCAKIMGRHDMAQYATKSYIGAVRGINVALSKPETAAQDSTVLCIVLAAMFEILAASYKHGVNNCTKHMEGAVTVALMHVKHGNQTEVTQKILGTLVQGFILYSWLNNRPLPPGFDELTKYTDASFYSSPMHYACLTVAMDVVNFRHALQIGTYKNPLTIILKALEIDSAIDDFALSMQPPARFEIFRTSKYGVGHLVYDGYYHGYCSPFITHTWNLARCASIHLRRVILQQCRFLSYSPRLEHYGYGCLQRKEAEAKITASAIEIAATVPQLGGYDALLEASETAPEYNSPPPDETPSRAGLEEADPRESITTASMGLAPHMIITTLRSSRSASSSSPDSKSTPPSSVDDENHIDSTPPPPPPEIVVPPPPTDNVHHILFQLYLLQEIKHLPPSLKEWIEGRIDWLEPYSTPKALAEQRVICNRFWPIRG